MTETMIHAKPGGGSSITRKTVTLTPELARCYLDSNSNNRRINAGAVADYSASMRRGGWRYNPGDSAITFDDRGVLINGQHRCLAVIDSGCSIRVDTVSGVATDLREVFDTGRARRASEVMAMRGESNTITLAAVAMVQWRHLRALDRVRRNVAPYHLTTGFREKASNQEIADLVEEFPLLRSSALASKAMEPKKLVAPAIGGWVHFRLTNAGPDIIDDFWAKVCTGIGVERNDAIHALRRNLLNRMGRGLSANQEQEYVAAVIFKTWNAWIMGKPVSVMAWTINEPFPHPITAGEA